MRFPSLVLLAIVGFGRVAADQSSGTVVNQLIQSVHLRNDMGESASRVISIYLPPGYADSDRHYPVIHFLHGNTMLEPMARLLDQAIAARRIRPFILAISNQKTTYGGSFYSNSGVFGNWEDFAVQDAVAYVNDNYRTIPAAGSRGITGHSMGGYGALLLALKHPDVFGAVYALSPGGLAIVREYGPNSSTFRELSQITTEEALAQTYFCKLMIGYRRSWSPNPDKPPFFTDLPLGYIDGNLVVNVEASRKWQANMPLYMIDDYRKNLLKLRAIKLDWGVATRASDSRSSARCSASASRTPVSLDFAEEYIGTHVSHIYTARGSIAAADASVLRLLLRFRADVILDKAGMEGLLLVGSPVCDSDIASVKKFSDRSATITLPSGKYHFAAKRTC